MNWERLYPNLSFTVENKIDNLHRIRLSRCSITSDCKNLSMNWEKKFSMRKNEILEHVYMRPEENLNRFEISNRFEMLFRLHGNLHGDFTVATFQTIARRYCTCANDIS